MANVCIPFGVQSVERGFARHGLAHAFLDCLLIVELVELHTLRRDLLLLTDSRDALSLKLRAAGGQVCGMALRMLLESVLRNPQALRGARQLSPQGLRELLISSLTRREHKAEPRASKHERLGQ